MTIFLGLGLSAAITGFMVGASNSPVVGSILSALFGSIGTVVGLNLKPEKNPENEGLKQSKWPQKIGAGLICASIFYTGGLLTGIISRTHLWFVPDYVVSKAYPKREFPWASTNKPFYLETALRWLSIQEELLNAGYKPEDVKHLYEMSVEANKVLKNLKDADVPREEYPYKPDLPSEVFSRSATEAQRNNEGAGGSLRSSPGLGRPGTRRGGASER
ncbi:MAG: hypothetical protein AAGN15_07370 [Cyanobacteria bacterium J06581_3]